MEKPGQYSHSDYEELIDLEVKLKNFYTDADAHIKACLDTAPNDATIVFDDEYWSKTERTSDYPQSQDVEQPPEGWIVAPNGDWLPATS
jgi:hypothetical protein